MQDKDLRRLMTLSHAQLIAKILQQEDQLLDKSMQIKSQAEQIDNQFKKIDSQSRQLDNQSKQLTDQSKQIDEQAKRINDQFKQINNQTKQIEEQAKRISDLQNQVEILLEMQRLARVEKYKPKCEQVETLFDETEVINLFCEDTEEDETIVKQHVRKKRSPRLCAQAPEDSPVYDNDHTKNAPAFLIKDEIRYSRIEDKIINKIAYTPAVFSVERNIYAQYKADCEEEKKIVLYDNAQLDGLGCSTSFAANLAVAKYDDHLPLYRQSEMLLRSNIRLGRQTMAKWIITWYSHLLNVERYFTKTMYKMKFLHMDETPLQVLDFRTETGQISKSSFMFIRQGSSYNEKDKKTRRLVSCSYIQSRSKVTLMDDYLKYGCTSAVMTDGLQSYVFDKHCNCWVHAVRKFKTILKDHEEQNAKAIIILFDKLYKTEDKYRKQLLDGSIDTSTFLSLRKEECLKVMKKIFTFANSIMLKYPDGAMRKAINYLLERQDTLVNYLDYVEATPDNNASERIAKAFATGRKNWNFSQTVDGADASCFMYSAIESAKANGLNPLDYMEFLFTFGPIAKTEEDFEALLPWNADISRINDMQEARKNACPDHDRSTPYIFTGASR